MRRHALISRLAGCATSLATQASTTRSTLLQTRCAASSTSSTQRAAAAVASTSGRGSTGQHSATSSDTGMDLSFYDSTIEKVAQIEASKTFTIKEMLNVGLGDSFGDGRKTGIGWSPYKTLTFGKYVHKELPVRLARRLLDLQFLPYVVVTNPHIREVYRAYLAAFRELREFPEMKSVEDNERFTKVLLRLVDRSAPLLNTMAVGWRECRKKPLVGDMLERHAHMEAFLRSSQRSRIARRVLSEQYVALQRPREGFIGIFEVEMRVSDVIDKAAMEADEICQSTFGCAPRIEIVGDIDAAITYIPAHLEYIMFEILKNASRAVTEKHKKINARATEEDDDDLLPAVRVLVFKHDGDGAVTIKVSDQGGGMTNKKRDAEGDTKDEIDKAFEFGYTTASDEVAHDVGAESASDGLGALGADGGAAAGGLGDGGGRNPMAGYGFGLPLSRLYAEYFGGSLNVNTIPGYGTDVVVHLKNAKDCETVL